VINEHTVLFAMKENDHKYHEMLCTMIRLF